MTARSNHFSFEFLYLKQKLNLESLINTINIVSGSHKNTETNSHLYFLNSDAFHFAFTESSCVWLLFATETS